jgi:hypothetical protein
MWLLPWSRKNIVTSWESNKFKLDQRIICMNFFVPFFWFFFHVYMHGHAKRTHTLTIVYIHRRTHAHAIQANHVHAKHVYKQILPHANQMYKVAYKII